MAHKGETTKSGYLKFDPGGMSIINWRPTLGQVQNIADPHKGNPNSYPINNPT